jgi:membrane-associated phospholipid phosphatase
MIDLKKHNPTVSGLSILYLILSYFLIGLKSEQIFLVVLFNLMFYMSAISKRIILGFSIFIVYWILFDYMKAFPNYNYNDVDIEGIYHLERKLFGLNYQGNLLSPNEFFYVERKTYLDVLSGIFYLTWVPVPLLFALYLFFNRREQFLYFSLTFLFINILGFIFYYVHPAAPPWYIQQFGFDFNPVTLGNTAGLARFDSYFGVEIFKSIYAKSSNVFAAMPSLHSSYPVLVVYYGIRNKLGTINILFGFIMVGIWFAAVYSGHHYVLDVLAGIVCALSGIWLFAYLLKLENVQKFIQNLLKAIQ